MDRILSVGNKIELSKIKKNKDDDAVTYVSQILDMKDEKIVDIRKVYKNGVTDSVIESYRSYLKQLKEWDSQIHRKHLKM